MSHACQLLNSSVVLLSGGLDQSKIQPDELYNIISEEVVKVISFKKSLRRAQHAMLRIGDRILAFGGIDPKNRVSTRIAEFNTETNAWDKLAQKLHSTNTSELLVTPFPLSALDCSPECRCGNVRKGRIYDGSKAEVRSSCGLCQSKAPFY